MISGKSSQHQDVTKYFTTVYVVHRRELYHIQRELLREQTRCKALEEELENPMNIHRWRKLEGSDPSTYEMVQKIHTLQRRLIQKTQEVQQIHTVTRIHVHAHVYLQHYY